MDKQRIINCKEKLDHISSLLEKIIAGEINQVQAAKELGITPNNFSNNLKNSFTPFLKSKKILTKDIFTGYLEEIESPCEKLIKNVLGFHPEDKMIIVDIASEETFLSVIKSTLKEREYLVLKSLYGLEDCESPKTLTQAGKLLGICSERTRQIENMALRKLRKPDVLRQLLPGYKDFFTAVEELDLFMNLNRQLDEDYKHVISQLRWRKFQRYFVSFCKSFDQSSGTILYLTDCPGFHKEWADALHNAGIYSIYDLLDTGEDKLKIIFEENHLDINEFYFFCEVEHCLPLCSTSSLDDAIDVLNLSARSYNALKRNGINTVRSLSVLSLQQLKSIRCLGERSVNEICEKLKGKYNIAIH